MNRIVQIAAAVLLAAALGGFFALHSAQAQAQAQAPPLCFSIEPGVYEFEVPALAGNPEGTLIATIGEGGELRSLIEPGGVDLVAIGAVHGLLPLYEPHFPPGLALVDCPWTGASGLPSTGTGGIADSGGFSAQTVGLVFAAALGCSLLALFTLLARSRRPR